MSKLLERGFVHLNSAMAAIDAKDPSSPSLAACFAWDWKDCPHIYHPADCNERASVSTHAAANVALGLMMDPFLNAVDSVLHSQDPILRAKLETFLDAIECNVSSLRSSTKREAWMYLATYAKDDCVGVPRVLNWLVERKEFPQLSFDLDGGNLLDYLVFHSFDFVDDFLSVLKTNQSGAWWQEQWNTGQLKGAWEDGRIEPPAQERATAIKALVDWSVLNETLAPTASPMSKVKKI